MGRIYTSRLSDALHFAAEAFSEVKRKNTGAPYLTHLLHVMNLVAEAGADEDTMIAALLHDYLEDISGALAEDIESRFGAPVTQMVIALTEPDRRQFSWQERKAHYLVSLQNASSRVRLISAADKTHNLMSLNNELRTFGADIWRNFSSSPQETRNFYSNVFQIVEAECPQPLRSRFENELKILSSTEF